MASLSELIQVTPFFFGGSALWLFLGSPLGVGVLVSHTHSLA